jgi:hypothetical protein
MDNLFLNRMNSQQGIVKKKQETIFEISIGSLHFLKILLKIQFRCAPVFSNDPYAAQTAFDLKKDHPFRYIQGFKRKTPRPRFISIPLIHMCCMCSRGVLSRVRILAEWLRHFNGLTVGATAAPACFLRENAEGVGMPPLPSH